MKHEHMPTNKDHKHTLKHVLTQNYTELQSAAETSNTRRPLFGKRHVAALVTAVIAIVLVGGMFYTSHSTPLTAQRVFAQAQEAYENDIFDKRYVYQKARTTSTNKADPFGNSITERWIDTETGNELNIQSHEDGTVLNKFLMIDGQSYSYFNEAAFGEGTFPVAGEAEFEATDAFYKDVDETGFPNGYKTIGFNSYEELDAADLSMKEIDDRLVAAGLAPINSFAADDPLYDTKPSQMPLSIYTPAGTEVDAAELELFNQEQYEQCTAAEEEFEHTKQLQVFFEASEPEEYAKAFEALSMNDFFTLDETTWEGRDVYSLRFSSNIPFGDGGGETVFYLDRETYALAGIEDSFILGSKTGEDTESFYKVVVLEHSSSDTPFDTSTKGLEKNPTPPFFGLEDMDSSFNCEEILNQPVHPEALPPGLFEDFPVETQ